MGCRGAAQDALDLAVAAVDRLDGPRAPDPLAGRRVDALVWDVEHRRNGRIAAVGVGDEQRIRCDDRLQPLLHAVCVEGGQGMAEGLARTVGGDQDRPRRARDRVCGPSRRAGAACGPVSASPLRLSRTTVSSASTIPASRSGAWGTAARKRWRRARRNPAALGSLPDRLAGARRGAKGQSARRTSSHRPCTGHGEDRAPNSAARHPLPDRSPPARPRPPAGPTALPPPPCAAPPQLIDTREPIPKPS